MIFYILILTSAISWIGLILAQIGEFSLRTLLLFLLALLILIRSWVLKSLPKPALLKNFSKLNFGFLLILILCALLYAKPHEFLVGHWDPGTYMNTGLHIAQKGSVEIRDPLLADLSLKEMELFVYPKPGSTLYPGFYVKDPGQGTLVPQFYHVFPVWIAIFYKLFGSYGSLFVNYFFVLLSLWTFWNLVQRMFNSRMAITATAILGFSIPQIWNARFPTSEVLAQYFVLSGAYAFCLFEKERRNIYGVLSGLAFGMALLDRPTAILLVPCLAIYLPCRNWVRFEKRDWAFFIPFFMAGVHLFIQSQLWTRYYAGSLVHFFNPKEKLFYSALAVCFLATFILIALFRKTFQTWFRKTAVQRTGALILSSSVFAWGVYSYWIRPYLNNNSAESYNLVALGWFLGCVILFVGMAGAVLWSYQGIKRENLLIFILFLVETVFFLDKKRTYSSYPWALKRYTPIVLPAFAVWASYAFEWLRSRYLSGKKIFLLILIIGGAILLPYVQGYRFIFRTDYQGLVPFLENLNTKIDPNGVYLFDRDWLALPIQNLLGKRTLVLPSYEKFPDVEPILLRWLGRGEKIYYFGYEEHPFSQKLNFKILNLKIPILKTTVMESSYGTYPKRIKNMIYKPRIYEVSELKQDQGKDAGEFIVKIGHNGIGLLKGFDKVRRYPDPDQKYCWTQGRSEILLKDEISSQELLIELRIKNPRPKVLGPTDVLIKLNEVRAGLLTIKPQTGLTTYRKKISKSQLGEKPLREIVLECQPWNPKKVGASQDDRDLGIILDWIKIKGANGKTLRWIDIGMEKRDRLDGFYKAENNPEAFFIGRWTQGKAELVMPWFTDHSSADLILRVDGFRKPPKADSQERSRKSKEKYEADTKIKVLVDGKILTKDMIIPAHLSIIRIPIPKKLLNQHKNRVVLTIESNTWNPYQAGIKSFPYRLGVLLDWIKIKKSA